MRGSRLRRLLHSAPPQPHPRGRGGCARRSPRGPICCQVSEPPCHCQHVLPSMHPLSVPRPPPESCRVPAPHPPGVRQALLGTQHAQDSPVAHKAAVQGLQGRCGARQPSEGTTAPLSTSVLLTRGLPDPSVLQSHSTSRSKCGGTGGPPPPSGCPAGWVRVRLGAQPWAEGSPLTVQVVGQVPAITVLQQTISTAWSAALPGPPTTLHRSPAPGLLPGAGVPRNSYLRGQ